MSARPDSVHARAGLGGAGVYPWRSVEISGPARHGRPAKPACRKTAADLAYLALLATDARTEELAHRSDHRVQLNWLAQEPLACRQRPTRQVRRPEGGEVDCTNSWPFAPHGGDQRMPLQVLVVAAVHAGNHHPRRLGVPQLEG